MNKTFRMGLLSDLARPGEEQVIDFTRYDIKNVKTVSWEVVSNRPKVNSFRAPCVPQVVFGVEGILSELADKIGMDQIDFRLKNAMVTGSKTIYGETFGVIGFVWIKLGCSPAPMLLGFVLGPMMEEHLRRAMLMSKGDPSVFVTRPISLAFIIATVAILVVMIAPVVRKRRADIAG